MKFAYVCVVSLKPILIAEDDENDAEIFRLVCERCHIRNPLMFVSDGDEAMAYLKREGQFENAEASPEPAIVLLDLKMKRMGGLQFLGWRQTQPKASFPIIILTGLQDIYQMREAYQMGAHSFLIKPVDPKDFASFIDKFKGIEVGT